MELNVQEPWYDEILTRHKTVEGRPDPMGYYESWIGKYITIKCDNSFTVVKVIKVKHYNNLKGYLDNEWKKAAPHTKSREEAEKAYRDVYYYKNGEKIQ